MPITAAEVPKAKQSNIRKVWKFLFLRKTAKPVSSSYSPGTWKPAVKVTFIYIVIAVILNLAIGVSLRALSYALLAPRISALTSSRAIPCFMKFFKPFCHSSMHFCSLSNHSFNSKCGLYYTLTLLHPTSFCLSIYLVLWEFNNVVFFPPWQSHIGAMAPKNI